MKLVFCCTLCLETYYFCDEAVIQQHSCKCHPTTCFYVIICQIQLLCEGIFLKKFNEGNELATGSSVKLKETKERCKE